MNYQRASATMLILATSLTAHAQTSSAPQATTMSLGQSQVGPAQQTAPSVAPVNMGVTNAAPANGAAPIRIAVLDFKYTDPDGSSKTPMQTDDSPWTELAEKVAAKLGIDAGFTVVHGKGEDHITVSLAPGQVADSDQSTAAKIGALLGVDAVLIGSIEDSLLTPHAAANKDGKSAPEKEISLHARLVDAKTGQTLSVVNGVGYTPPMDEARLASCKGSKSEKADCVARNAPAANWTQGAGFQEASSQAVDSLVDGLSTADNSAPMMRRGNTGTIFDADGGSATVLTNEGHLPAIGTRLVVTRPTGLSKDASGNLTRSQDILIGYITVSSTDGSLATGSFQGSSQPKVGDAVSVATK